MQFERLCGYHEHSEIKGLPADVWTNEMLYLASAFMRRVKHNPRFRTQLGLPAVPVWFAWVTTISVDIETILGDKVQCYLDELRDVAVATKDILRTCWEWAKATGADVNDKRDECTHTLNQLELCINRYM